MTRTVITVADKKIGDGYPCFIVAEAGVNHNGSLEIAKQLIVAAKEVGADAVKFQIFIPEEIVSPDAAKADYQKETTGEGSQYEMLKKLTLTEEEFRELRNWAKKVGIIFFATPHDLASVDIFKRLDLPIIKVASPDVNNALLFKKLAGNEKLKTKALFLSTGASTLEEVKKSVSFLKANGFVGPILIYHCVSAYPVPPKDQNLKVIETFKNEFPNLTIGFSDNTGDIDIVCAAVYLGAVSIETNITMDRNMEGPDQRISSNPDEFARIVREIRKIEKNPDSFIEALESKKIQEALGDGNKRVMPSEVSTMKIARKSIVASGDLAEGDVVTLDMLSARRPMGGLSPMEYKQLISKRLVKPVEKDTQLTLKDVK
jgi:sialic acid synthase SpsE